MVDASLVATDALVRSYLDMAVEVPSNQDRSVVRHELDRLLYPWPADELQHDLGRYHFVVVHHLVEVRRLYAALVALPQVFVLAEVIEDEPDDDVALPHANDSTRLEDGWLLDSYEGAGPIAHVFHQVLVLEGAVSDPEVVDTDGFIIVQNDVVLDQAVVL